ncbi:MAG TPA: hypothetical protein VGD48_34705 [Kutzneria sp.]|jgi:hypothetical protein
MSSPADEPELTSYEQALLGSPVEYRGYTPDDDIPEPTVGPSEPAGPSKTDRGPKPA